MQNNDKNESNQPELKRTDKFRVRPVEANERQYNFGMNRVSMLMEQRRIAEEKEKEGRGK